MDHISATPPWPESLLLEYSSMLSVSDVAQVLNLDERAVRNLLLTPDASTRLPGVKIGKSWRLAKSELSAYLLAHDNSQASRAATAVAE